MQIVKDKIQAERVFKFLTKKGTFDTTLSSAEVKDLHRSILKTIDDENARYWFIEKDKKIIAAIGIGENEVKTGGYFLNFFAVDKDHQRSGLGQKLLDIVEEFVRARKGRYITIDTGDTNGFEAARNFYEKNEYKKVGHIPEYYYPDEGRIDYYKKFNY